MWLGDPSLAPVFDESNRHHAAVYSHPTDATCCHALLPNTSPGTIEWQADTARTIFNVINEPSVGRTHGLDGPTLTVAAQVREEGGGRMASATRALLAVLGVLLMRKDLERESGRAPNLSARRRRFGAGAHQLVIPMNVDNALAFVPLR